jgi:hypothetical protein
MLSMENIRLKEISGCNQCSCSVSNVSGIFLERDQDNKKNQEMTGSAIISLLSVISITPRWIRYVLWIRSIV